jgi:pimeloyl-ACP methyl ester carboxylesterase
MLRLIVLSAFFVSFTQCYGQPLQGTCNNTDSLQWAATGLGCLHFYAFKNANITASPVLVIVIHGDAPFNKPGYQYTAAHTIALQNNNTIAVGLLRPGYTDPDGNTSAGVKGLTTGDNYTPGNINAIAQAIERLKKLYHPKKTILVGHSGGSAITADIIGLKPALVNKAVVVSCPCYLTPWREYMSRKQPGFSAWKDSVTSVSPNTVAANISKGTKVIIISGTGDDVTPTQLSVDYYNLLKNYGIDAGLIQIAGEKHDILLHSKVFEAIKTLIAN